MPKVPSLEPCAPVPGPVQGRAGPQRLGGSGCVCALPAHTHTHTHSSAHTHRGLPHAGGVLCLREMGQQVPAPYQMRTLSPRGASDRSTADFRAGTPDSALGLRLPFPMCPIQMSGRCWNPVVMHVCRTSGLSLPVRGLPGGDGARWPRAPSSPPTMWPSTIFLGSI